MRRSAPNAASHSAVHFLNLRISWSAFVIRMVVCCSNPSITAYSRCARSSNSRPLRWHVVTRTCGLVIGVLMWRAHSAFARSNDGAGSICYKERKETMLQTTEQGTEHGTLTHDNPLTRQEWRPIAYELLESAASSHLIFRSSSKCVRRWRRIDRGCRSEP